MKAWEGCQRETCHMFWMFLGFALIALLIGLSGCASEQEIVKPNNSIPIVKPVTIAPKPVIPVTPTVKEVKDVLHFVTFKSEPIGAGVYVIDSQTGKEVGFLGTTPTHFLLMKKRVEVEGFRVTCTGMVTNAAGLTLSGKSGKVELIEFQFKFKHPGFYDDIKLEKIQLNTASDTDTVVSISLVSVKVK